MLKKFLRTKKTPRQPKPIGGLPWVWLSVLVVLLDQIVKFIIVAQIQPYNEVSVVPGFKLTLLFNTGAAFSFLNSQSGWQVWFFSIITIAICFVLLLWLQRLKASQVWLCIAIAFILGGAIGNLVDRLTLGYVIDYFLFYAGHWSWPAFNVADSAITIGAIMLVIDLLFKQKRAKRANKE